MSAVPSPSPSAEPRIRVGFIGLGSQGAPMARRIIDVGFPMTLWARRPDTLEPFAGTHAVVADSPAKLAAVCDLVCLCVRDDADVEAVTLGPDGVLAGLRPGGVIAVQSTVHPDTCLRLADAATTRAAGRVVDAPVSGGGTAAEAGRLLVMVGGDEDTVAYCRPVFASYGDPVVHLGPLGAGQVTKLLNNAAFTAHLGIADSLLALGRALGVDPGRLGEVVLHGSGRSFALDRVASAGGTLDRIAGHAGHLLDKDVRLVIDLVNTADASSVNDATAAGDTLLTAARDALASMREAAASQRPVRNTPQA
jgi:3-hydroxyisobutyrate dehydrogenase-like beta-hydroxyacid dehydrogenase